MPALLSVNNAQYAVLTTAGTYTLNPGPSRGGIGVLWGVYVSTYGTSPVFNVYDVVPAMGTNAIATNLLLTGSGTAAGQAFSPLGAGSPAVRYTGALVVVVTGTSNALNVLWD
jgi:hypothetical protein